ncbi:RHS repeat-associated protein [Paenibacillus shirakamiensis]|uniref:RHS repeat-associated protein n=1 Tax=Paenibacillus shirakamiensis TaxID=1265935 RepID=A0ABS4JIJ5_9BACL|nr:RHS repeat-associated protein [Paenibacillus shirakamiensis]
MKGDSNLEESADKTYTFNAWDQLQTVIKGQQTTQFEYEMQGLRLYKSTGSVKTRYAYNNSGQVISEADATNQAVANYVWGPDQLLEKRDAASNKKYYYMYNGHGDVVQIIDENESVVNKYQYDEWGNILQQEEQVPNTFKYAGELQDAETGLYYLRARYYDPSAGRFISKDTYEGDVSNPLSQNLYTYVENAPLNNIDPTGNWCTYEKGNYSHPGGCNGGTRGEVFADVGTSKYLADSVSVNFGRNIVYNDVIQGKWYPKGSVHFSGDKTGLSDAVLGCWYDSQCAGFVSGAVTQAPAVYNEVKTGISKGWGYVMGLFSSSSASSASSASVKLLEQSIAKKDVILGAFENGKVTKQFLAETERVYGHKAFLEGSELGFVLLRTLRLVNMFLEA